MKWLENPPNWAEIVKNMDMDLFNLLSEQEIASYIGRMNDKYFYWDELKYRPRPANLTAEVAWALVKISRLSQRKHTNLRSESGSTFGYWLPDNVLRELHFIDQNATGQILIDEPTIGEPDKDRYIISSLMEEAIASSILEGAATTRKKAKEMLREGRKPQTRGELMIQNNYATMKKIKDRISEKLSIELLCELQ